MGKYSLTESPAFDALVDRHMEIIAREAWTSSYSRHWKALILAGSYGRGEGTPFIGRDGQPFPFDGYRLVMVVNRTSPLLRGALRILSERMTAGFDVPVTVSPLLKSEIAASEHSFANFELKLGHRVIRGDENALGRMPAFAPEHMPLSEGTRHLTRHGCLLLEMKQRLGSGDALSTAERRRFTGVLLDTALAFGDSILLMRKAYHPSLKEKRARLRATELQGLYDARGIVNAFCKAADFRENGDYQLYESANLHMWLDETVRHFREVFLWLERRRLNRKFSIPKRYSHTFPDLGNEGTPLENAKRNLRIYGLRGLADATIHPRLRLYAATLLFLDDPLNLDELRWILRSHQGTVDGLYSEFCNLLKHCD